MIISGGADGIDALAEQYADAHRLSKWIVRPQYARYGRGAPLRRNREMVDMADAVLIVWDGKSKDRTRDLLKNTHERGVVQKIWKVL